MPMSIDLLSLHFTLALGAADMARNFLGAPAVILTVCVWSFRTIWRAAR